MVRSQRVQSVVRSQHVQSVVRSQRVETVLGHSTFSQWLGHSTLRTASSRTIVGFVFQLETLLVTVSVLCRRAQRPPINGHSILVYNMSHARSFIYHFVMSFIIRAYYIYRA